MTTKLKAVKLPAMIKTGEDGFFVVEIPVLPGCISQGKTKAEALANIKEAAHLYLKTVGLGKYKIPGQYQLTDIEIEI